VRLAWQLPTQVFVQSVLENPIYAGAYVWGRRPVEVVFENGQLRRRIGCQRRAEECKGGRRRRRRGRGRVVDGQAPQINDGQAGAERVVTGRRKMAERPSSAAAAAAWAGGDVPGSIASQSGW